MGSLSVLSSHRALLVVLAAGLVLRIAFVLLHQRPVVSDEKEYDQLAKSIVNDASYAVRGVPTAYRPVGYPVFLAMTYAAAGHRPVAAKILQALLDSLTALFLFLIGRSHSYRAGIIVAFLWSLYLPAILYTNLLLTESLTVFLITLSLFVFLKKHNQNSIYPFLICGFLMGTAILVKPTLLPFPFLFLLIAKKVSIPRLQLALLPLAAIIVIAPWMTRNLFVLDTLSLSTNIGINLYVGNNPSATGAYRGTFAEELSDTSVNEITRNEYALKLAVDHMVTHPGVFVLNGIKKVAHVFRSEGDALVGSFSPYSPLDKIGFKDQYRSLPIVVVAATNLSYYFLLLLGIAGFLASERGRLFWFTTVFFASSLLVHFIFFGGSRFHFPFMPFAALYAAEAAASFIDRQFVLSRTRKLLFLLSSIALTSLWSYELILIYLTH